MKRIINALSLLLICTTFLAGCTKEKSMEAGSASSNKATYYIKGKKNGTPFNYTAMTMAKITDFSSAGGFISLALIANAEANPTNFEGVVTSINFFNGTTPAVGTYSEDYTGTDYLAAGVYNPNSMSIVWSAGIKYPTAKPLKINIISKTATEITGTFEGAFYKEDISAATFYDEYIMFTECEFKLPIQ